MNTETLKFGPAAGMVKTVAQFDDAIESPATRVTLGTGREKTHSGNRVAPGRDGAVFAFDEPTRTSANAIGVPDIYGAAEYRRILPDMARKAEAKGKDFVFSIGAFTEDEDELGRMGVLCKLLKIRAQWNAGCPNIKAKGGPKVIPSCDLEVFERQLGVFHRYGIEEIEVKISPIGDDLILPLASLINRSGIVTRVVAVNTSPNYKMLHEDGSHALNYFGDDGVLYHTGGRAGAPLKEDALRVIRGMREHLAPHIGITGVGGIFAGSDASDHFDAGADSFEVGTACYVYGYKVLGDIVAGM